MQVAAVFTLWLLCAILQVLRIVLWLVPAWSHWEVDEGVACISRGGQIVYHRSPFSTILNLSDLFWYWDPYYYQRQRLRMARGEEMNFFEAIFSFVFGDGDPNDDYEEKRWKLVS